MTATARVGSYVARDGSERDVELAYDIFGERGRPLVLVMGIGAQRIFWDEALCEHFVAAGFQVIRFDHRDIGESTKLDAHVPPPMPTLIRGLIKLQVPAPYSLSGRNRFHKPAARAFGLSASTMDVGCQRSPSAICLWNVASFG